MLAKPPVYGLAIAFDGAVIDITPPTGRGTPGVDDSGPIGPDRGDPPAAPAVLDPGETVVIGAAISSTEGEEHYRGSERHILSLLDHRLAVVEPGLIVTWHGSVLDLALLRVRARSLDLELGLRIGPASGHHLRVIGEGEGREPLQPSYQVGRTGDGGFRPVTGTWHRHRHLDLRWAALETERAAEVAAADTGRRAHLARNLAEQRWGATRRHLSRTLRNEGQPRSNGARTGTGRPVEFPTPQHPARPGPAAPFEAMASPTEPCGVGLSLTAPTPLSARRRHPSARPGPAGPFNQPRP